MKKYQLLVLDRDGVINEDSPQYIKSPDEWQAISGSLEAIAKLNNHGIKVAVISNQSGIARGYFSEQALQTIHDKMTQELEKVNGHIDEIYYCPHHPDDNCECRKPKTKMLLEILKKFSVLPAEILVVGDSWCDVELAKNAGCDFALVKTGKGKLTMQEHLQELNGYSIFENLFELVNAL